MERDFHIDDWLINPQSAEIRRGDKIVKLEPKVMDLLIYLAEHCNQVVSREQIHDEVWKGVVVGDDALTAAIIKLRKALGDDSRNPRFIQTIPKKGYRLIAEIGKPDESTCDERKLERKLTAIIYADVVEYGRFISARCTLASASDRSSSSAACGWVTWMCGWSQALHLTFQFESLVKCKT